ncbi:MAG: site-2 protease family protein [Candidatus Melainabacteria bacterium]|nr:site-2 protease family protein [Candidatus Melainabacteria bacterium]
MESAILIIIVWILSVCLHEFGHAVTAFAGGDTTVKERGYLTLNPVVYFNSATTLVLPLFFLLIGGIPLPGAAVYIKHSLLRSRLWISAVSFAGPFFSFLCLIAFLFIFEAFSSNFLVHSSFALLIFLQTYTLILNLIPLPPLDGWGIIEPWMPENIRIAALRNGNIGFVVLMGLMWLTPAGDFMGALVFTIMDMFEIPSDLIRSSFLNFKSYSMPIAALIIVTFIVKNIKSPAQKAAEAERLKQDSSQIIDITPSKAPAGLDSDEKNKTQI